MAKMTRRDAIIKIADHYGLEHQQIKTIEELSELIQALAKGNRMNTLEEMADVTVMIKQLQYLMDVSDAELAALMDIKLERQLRRMVQKDGSGDKRVY